jgi:hypothetical protein
MAEEQYNPRRATKEYDIPIPETMSPFRSPFPFQQVFDDGGGGEGEGECNDGLDGQDGAQTDCSGDCHAYFA